METLYLIKDINLLENVQRRATKLMFKDKTIPYKVRIDSLSSTSLEPRRERDNMIEVFKL